MKQSSGILTDVFERITDAFVALDTNWCYTYMNKKAGEIFQRNPAQMIGKHIWTEFPEGIDQSFYKAYHRAMEQQQYIHVEEYYPPYDKWFENHIYPSPDGLSIFLKDITAKKKTEFALKESEERYRNFIEETHELLQSVGPAGEFLFVNKAWEQLLGYSASERATLRLFDIIHPESLQHCREIFKQILEGESVSSMEVTFIKKNGGQVILEGNAFPRVINSKVIATQSFFRNITERKKAEETLNQNRIFIESIINASPDIIYIYDIEEQKNIYVNEGIQSNLGYTDDDIKQMGNQLISILMHPEDFDYYLHNTYLKYEALKDKEIIAHDYRMKSIDGNWHWLHSKESIFLRKPDGTPKQIFGITSDITENKKTDLILAGEKNVLEMIATEKPLEEILNTLVLNYESYSDNTLCSIQLLNEDGTHIRHGAGPSLPDAYNKGIEGEPIGPIAGSCGTAAYRKERVIVSDIATDPLWINYRDFALGFGLKASWSTPIINAEGKVYGTFAIYYKECRTPVEGDLALIDRAANQVKIVLERYYKDTRIKQSEEKYRALVTASSDILYRMNPDWSLMYQLDGHGFIADNLKPNSNWFQEYIHHNDQAHVMSVIKEAIRTRSIFELEHPVFQVDGTLGWTFSRAVPLFDAKGDIVEWFGAASDITDRKKAEETIYNLNALLEQRVKERTAELEKTNAELEEVNDLFVGREARIIELKEELEALKMKLK